MECKHEYKDCENPKIYDLAYQNYVIIEYSVVCANCGKKLDEVERQKFVFEKLEHIKK